ncbi:MAG: double-strand break repair helicase AddA [Pseudomonadota bacterium]
MTLDDATRAQIGAADPAGSVWLAANAGSGKTRVLTDRVAWLLLDGAAPERILCLTYTKAAAGEMQNRLFKRLGAWAMLPDDDLRAEITRLGAVRGSIPPEKLRRARTLFARAIETPGGLKIQTIHAFCASLLRRFPLEAGVSPNFQEMDEIATARLHADILDDMAADPHFAPLVDGIAARLTDGEPSQFLAAIAANRDGLLPPANRRALRLSLGIEDESPDAVRADTVTSDDLSLVEAARDAAAPETGVTMTRLTDVLSQAVLADLPDRFDLLCAALLTQAGEPRKKPVTKAVAARLGADAVEALQDLAARLADARTRIAAFDALAQAEALHAFAPAFLTELDHRKAQRGWLDFDDQIEGARRLLRDGEMAQWVLFKLDGGLDHILVDEAQDTSPAQWDVIEALAAEFGAGQGARDDARRTLFVVGDRKQSIYSFQGADPDAFDRMRRTFDHRLAAGPPLRDHALRHSFRSSPTILGLVDATFAAGGGVGEAPEHVAFKADLPGRVDLWPVEAPEPEDLSDRLWHHPVDRPARNDAKVRLAARVADAVAGMLRQGTPVGHGPTRRAVGPGDILILLRRRKDLFHHVVRALKSHPGGIDVSGADRLRLSDDLAVRDLIAALTWAATPDDDLSLATVLRSPLGRMDEAGLFRVAHGRSGTLWRAVREGTTGPATDMLKDLLSVADILRPYELLQRLLVRHDGRRLLLARLGPESAEAIDALLGQALAYEQLETPSLTGFLGWFASADPELKRQGGGGAVRVMTVHGAKGLEAPVVILPECQAPRPRGPSGIQTLPDGIATWMPPKAAWPPILEDHADRVQMADAAEADRLLYVAMTRAESWLILGAAGDVGEDRHDSWYRKVEAAMVERGAVSHDDGLRLQSGDWAPLAARAATPVPDAPAPLWLEAPVAPPAAAAKPIAPSDLPGPKALPGEAADALSSAAALRRGTAIHALLEHLPDLAAAQRRAAAPAVLARHAALWPEDDAEGIVAEALAVLADPALAHLFAESTLAEVPFVLPARPARPAVTGTMDRIVPGAARILVVDYKSNAVRPDGPGATPIGLLRQLGAYAEAAAAIWPDRPVETAILWTRDRALMPLPADLLARADAVPPDAKFS